MTYPEPLPHGELTQVLDNIYLVTGSVAMKVPHPKWGPLTMTFSRNMLVIKQGGELILINSVRLNDKGIAQLDELGDVKHVIRLAAFHGFDDPYYKETFGATLWSVDSPYVRALINRRRVINTIKPTDCSKRVQRFQLMVRLTLSFLRAHQKRDSFFWSETRGCLSLGIACKTGQKPTSTLTGSLK